MNTLYTASMEHRPEEVQPFRHAHRYPRRRPAAVGDRRSLYKAFAASLSGTSLEWYDFAVYSSAAALVFGDLFFPGSDPLTGTLQAFATYAVGLRRPPARRHLVRPARRQ